MRTTSGRLALGLAVAVASVAAVSGCTDDPDRSRRHPRRSSRRPPRARRAAARRRPAPPRRCPRWPRCSAPPARRRSPRRPVTSSARRPTRAQPLRIDVEGTADGANQTVFITTPDGGTSEVVMVGDDYWLGGDEAFWVHQTGDAQAGRRAWSASTCRSRSPTPPSSGRTPCAASSPSCSPPPEFAALESDTSAASETGRSTAGPPTCSGEEGGAAPVGGDRRQRHGAADRRAGERAVRPRVLGLGAGRGPSTPPPPSKVVEG